MWTNESRVLRATRKSRHQNQNILSDRQKLWNIQVGMSGNLAMTSSHAMKEESTRRGGSGRDEDTKRLCPFHGAFSPSVALFGCSRATSCTSLAGVYGALKWTTRSPERRESLRDATPTRRSHLVPRLTRTVYCSTSEAFGSFISRSCGRQDRSGENANRGRFAT